MHEGFVVITFLAQGNESTGQYTSLIFLALLFGAMYFLMIRPQQKRRRQYLDLLGSLQVGDEIETVAGIFGTIRRLDDDFAWIEVADGLTLKMSRGAVRRKVTTDTGTDAVA